MTLSELGDLLDAIPSFSGRVTYRAFSPGNVPNLPYICYLVSDADPFFADDSVYFSCDNVDVELYTEQKDPEAETLLEEALTGAHIPWTKSEEWLDSERCFMIIYHITI